MKVKYNIGVDVGGAGIKYGIVSSWGRIIHSGIISLDSKKNKREVLIKLKEVISSLLLLAKERKIEINHLGVGVPGTVDILKGKIIGKPPNLPYLADYPLRGYLQKHFTNPIYVDNDANVMTLAEFKLGSAKKYNNCICITLGTGIGSGVILNEKLFRGFSYVGPELGHTTICFHGVRCNCDNFGCVEMYASEPAMIKRARELLKKSRGSILYRLTQGNLNRLKAKELFEAKKLRDKIAVKVVRDTAFYLGAALANAVNLFNPEIVVIGGGVIHSSTKDFIKRIEVEMKKRAFPSATKNLKVVKAKLGNDAGFVGASILGDELKS